MQTPSNLFAACANFPGNIQRTLTGRLKLSRTLLSSRPHTIGFRRQTLVTRTGRFRGQTVRLRQLLLDLPVYSIRPRLGLVHSAKRTPGRGTEIAANLSRQTTKSTLGLHDLTVGSLNGGIRGPRSLHNACCTLGRGPLAHLRSAKNTTCRLISKALRRSACGGRCALRTLQGAKARLDLPRDLSG